MRTQPDLTDTHNAECRSAWGIGIGANAYLHSQPGGDECVTCRMGTTIQRVRDLADTWQSSRPQLTLYATLAGHDLRRALDGDRA